MIKSAPGPWPHAHTQIRKSNHAHLQPHARSPTLPTQILKKSTEYEAAFLKNKEKLSGRLYLNR